MRSHADCRVMVSRREHGSVAVICLSPGSSVQSIPQHTGTGSRHPAHEHTFHGLSRQEGGTVAIAHDIGRLAAKAFLRESEGE